MCFRRLFSILGEDFEQRREDGGDIQLCRGDEAEPIILYFKDIGFTRPVHARDLWAHKDLGSLRDSYTVTVPQDAVVMLQIWR